MKKYLSYAILALVLLAGIFFKFYDNTNQNHTNQAANPTSQTSNHSKTTNHFNISDLKDTKNFNANALEHIFIGTINKDKEATGYHYEGLTQDVELIKSTLSKEDKNGVYRAKIKIKGIEKNAYSSFFPKTWSAQDVVNAINEAYVNKKHLTNNTYEGTSKNIKIQMYLTQDNKIISAFPVYQK